MNPGTTQTSMQVYAASQEQYKTPPNASQMDVGVVPLDTLPASWWNWLWEQITKNNNAVYQGIADIRTELLNVLSDANITPSELDATQLLQAINVIRKRVPTTDPVSHDPIPGAVISSASRSSVSVDSTTGEMTVNALSDWTSQDSVKDVIDAWETEQEQDLQDGLTSIENTITARAHVLCLEVEETTGQYTNTSYSLNTLSRVDGRPLSSYTPAEGDVLILHFSAASLYQTGTHTGGTLTVGQYSFTWTLTADFDDYVLLVLTGMTTCNVCFGIHKPTLTDILDVTYPVGTIYQNGSVNTNPSTLFGVGTWEKIEGKFLYGTATGTSLGSTGGASTVTLREANMPSHYHSTNIGSASGAISGGISSGAKNWNGSYWADDGLSARFYGLGLGATSGTIMHCFSPYTEGHCGTDNNCPPGFSVAGLAIAGSGNWINENRTSVYFGFNHVHEMNGSVSVDFGTKDTDSKGSGTAFSIIPPYVAVNIWKRTAQNEKDNNLQGTA